MRHALTPLVLLVLAALFPTTWHGPAAEAREAAWQRIDGPPGTGCALGSPFSFFVRRGSSRRVMVFFQGGGACWDEKTCEVGDDPVFDPLVDDRDNPARMRGLLDLAHPRNPVRDFTVVFVPYCTADLFLGNRTRSFTVTSQGGRGKTFEIQHRGAANASAVLDWVTRTLRAPDLVFVTGSSAGAPVSPVFAARLAGHYPSARVVQLGDSAGGYRAPSVPTHLEEWGATELLRGGSRGYRAIDPHGLMLESLYVVSAREAPRVSYAQVNFVEDQVQTMFLDMLGVRGVRLSELLGANLRDIRREDPRFRTFTAPGAQHVALLDPDFYSVTVEGITLVDWTAGLLNGRPVRDVGSTLLPHMQ